MDCEDACHNEYLGDCGDGSCDGCYGEDDRCLLLQGLAGATNLELISEYSADLDTGPSGSYNPAEYFLVSKHLKVVEIHCNEEDEWINQIVNTLGIHGVTSAQISIKHDSWSSFRFSFQQPK
ncbi:uncharacterized protein LOC119280592 isoform X2 [Triticum dicoccoides]|uniref:uncharacterized protein LOC119280592 isoform X2 n=1 Tax=Triticum dicoccoides TaxID=85692 RepID=UPI00188EE2D3|nr:uncharacterized protein LOC119280592 isoform X2 [Triticum dicoccoides]